MKLLFIGHSDHQKTKSSHFIIDLLRNKYEVFEIDFNPQFQYTYENLIPYKGECFDSLVIWEVAPNISELKKYITWRHAAYFPMYDFYYGNNGLYSEIWKEYSNFVIICFSKKLYDEIKSNGLDARYIQYFPAPQEISNWGSEDSVYFWQRLSDLNLNTLAKSLKDLSIHHIHHHKVFDPGHSLQPLNASEEVNTFLQKVRFSDSKWTESRKELQDQICESALYMAPRPFEGIGMSFLEAMAAGRCVIAPDNATMNEYITDGVNGFLYPWEDYTESHCGASVKVPNITIKEIQKNAHQYITEGYVKWNVEKYNILEWIQEKPQIDYIKVEKSAILHGWKDWPIDQQPWPDAEELKKQLLVKEPSEAKCPKTPFDVSVITVVYNAIQGGRKDMILQCLDSVQSQTGINIEHIIVDGASPDGTLDLLKAYNNKRHKVYILSMKDQSIYEAMNRGIALSQGKYITFLNSDDFYHDPEGLKMSVDKLLKTDCSYSFAPVKILSQVPSFVANHPHLCPHEYINGIFARAVFSHQSVLVKRSVMLDFHGFDLSYRSSADYDMILRMFFEGHRGCYVNHTFVSFRYGGFSSINVKVSQEETALVFRRLYSKYFGIHLSQAEGILMQIRGTVLDSFPKARLKACLSHAFVGLPKNDLSWKERLYWPEIKATVKYILSFKFKKLFYFFIIHFNSRFNRAWYYLTYSDVKNTNIAPAKHYLEYGWEEGRNPSAKFSTYGYLKNNPDVKKMNICPLVHWKLKGKKQKRTYNIWE